jgi:DNA-binding transcriptional MerR regulator
MARRRRKVELSTIPAKRYFTIGEASELCGVKPHVIHYWQQQFPQLGPVKLSRNRRYYEHHELLLIRHIRKLLYEEGFTIRGARNCVDDSISAENSRLTTGRQTPSHGNSADLAAIRRELREVLKKLGQ